MATPKVHPLFRRALVVNSWLLLLLVAWAIQLGLKVGAHHHEARQHAEWLASAHRLADSFGQLLATDASLQPARLPASSNAILKEVARLLADLQQAGDSGALRLELDLTRAQQAVQQLEALRRLPEAPQAEIQPLAASVAADLHNLMLELRTQLLKSLALAATAEQRLRSALLQLLLLGGLNAVLLLLFSHRHQLTQQALDTLEVRAVHDVPTGVWNRETILKLFHHEAERAERGSLPLSVLKIQPRVVDGKLPPEAQESLLRETAIRISATVRPFDAVGRIGDDVFLVVLPNCPAHFTNLVAERLRKRMQQEPVACDGVTLKIAPLIGAAGQGEVLASSAYVLVRAADAALLRATEPASSGFELAGQADLDRALDPKVGSTPGQTRRRA